MLAILKCLPYKHEDPLKMCTCAPMPTHTCTHMHMKTHREDWKGRERGGEGERRGGGKGRKRRGGGEGGRRKQEGRKKKKKEEKKECI